MKPSRLLASLAGVVVVGCGLSVVGAGTDDSPKTADAASDAVSTRDVVARPPEVTPDALADSAVDAGPPRVLKFEQSAPGAVTATSYTFNVGSTKAGSFVALIISVNQAESTNIVSVSDNATGGSSSYSSADAKAVAPGCQGTDIWYARNVRPATQFIITLSKSSTLQAWFLEVSGLLATGAPTTRSALAGTGTATTPASITVDNAPALVVAGVSSCDFIGAKNAENPIVDIAVQQGNSGGYFIATAPGTLNIGWANQKNTGWNQSVAVFH